MSQLIEEFSSRDDVIIDLILVGRKREISYSLPASIHIHRPEFPFDDGKRFASTVKTVRFIRKKVNELQPDTILSFGEYWNNLVLLSLTGMSYPVYISDRSEPGKNLGTLQNRLRNMLYPKAVGYIAQTDRAAEIAKENNWNQNITVIGNPIRQITANGAQQRENIVLTIGRFIKTKHFDHLVEVFAEINQPGWKLVIVGDDAKKQQLSKELKALIHDLNVEEKVSMVGYRSNVEDFYNESKIFAFTSSSEGFPNVIGEALSAGLPVVAYDCDAGPSDMISDGVNGHLVPLFDKDTFRKKLQDLMSDEELRIRFSSRTRDKIANFENQEIADRFFQFITENCQKNTEAV